MFDFTSLYHSEHAAKIYERKGRRLLALVVGDSLLEVKLLVWLLQALNILCWILFCSAQFKDYVYLLTTFERICIYKRFKS